MNKLSRRGDASSQFGKFCVTPPEQGIATGRLDQLLTPAVCASTRRIVVDGKKTFAPRAARGIARRIPTSEALRARQIGTTHRLERRKQQGQHDQPAFLTQILERFTISTRRDREETVEGVTDLQHRRESALSPIVFLQTV
jgi:hypothetical protein